MRTPTVIKVISKFYFYSYFNSLSLDRDILFGWRQSNLIKFAIEYLNSFLKLLLNIVVFWQNCYSFEFSNQQKYKTLEEVLSSKEHCISDSLGGFVHFRHCPDILPRFIGNKITRWEFDKVRNFSLFDHKQPRTQKIRPNLISFGNGSGITGTYSR